MMQKTATTAHPDFLEDVRKGLTAYPKHLSSRYIYDARGDALFQQIMKLPEYYLTRCEQEILESKKKAIAQLFQQTPGPFQLIELGAGDGQKTRILLRELQEQQADFRYMPIDISANALRQLGDKLRREMPDLVLEPKEGSYFKVLRNLQAGELRKVILFLGSNIGNLMHEEAVEFLQQLQAVMKPEDLLFIGFDQKKHPQEIKAAYDDASGVTEAFNKNLLERINREMGANFQADKFMHWETYNPESGTAKSFLVALEAQQVTIPALELEIEFHAWETIHTEISQKYDDATVHWLAGKAGLEVVQEFADASQQYKDYVFRLRTKK